MQSIEEGTSAEALPSKKSRRRSTSHLKLVPPDRELREQLRARCAEVAARLDKSRPLTKDEMEADRAGARSRSMGLPEGYVGWMMVVLATRVLARSGGGRSAIAAGCSCCRTA